MLNVISVTTDMDAYCNYEELTICPKNTMSQKLRIRFCLYRNYDTFKIDKIKSWIYELLIEFDTCKDLALNIYPSHSYWNNYHFDLWGADIFTPSKKMLDIMYECAIDYYENKAINGIDINAANLIKLLGV